MKNSPITRATCYPTPTLFLTARPARQLAYLIHTEIGEGFIYAIKAREKRRIGENYVLKDRDIISIISAKKRA